MPRLSTGTDSKQNYETPSDLIYAIEKRFGKILVDLAADIFNKKARDFYSERYYSPESGCLGIDSLAQDWAQLSVFMRARAGVFFLNPPFKKIAPWAEKCAQTRPHLRTQHTIILLIPAAPGSNYHRDYFHNQCLNLWLNGRPIFDGKDPFPKDCALHVFGSNIEPDYDVWEWKKDVPEELLIKTRRAA